MMKRRPADRLQNLDQVHFRRTPVSKNICTSPITISPDFTWLDETQFENFLGSGSFGFVMGTRSKEAVKFISLSETDGPERDVERKQVTREYKTMVLAKNHPNIVQILACSEKFFTSDSLNDILHKVSLPEEVNDSIYLHAARARKHKIIIPTFCIKMAICGQSLREWLSDMHDKPRTSYMQDFQVEIISNLLAGFKYLHFHKIIHRDFRPENVLFSYSRHKKYKLPVKIGDFGLARFLPDYEERLTSRVGANSYRAPEAETSFYGVQADIFSLGLVFWEVLQLLDPKIRKSMFYKLVHDYENHPFLVEDHPRLVNAKELVVTMTKRLYRERLRTMEDVVLQLCEVQP
ncbi:interferon-induced, double-stranded RNA-activated protein kinase-like [Folsomia candida]|uniref:interferon-induced, double-stranded RNA-activated protein kinase-like n=1 Tax=Folsomia candida TaxID=158441 RepID=UPI0016053886|nr:interferon-induced, double-stranded RNA-activated protein kinase-like [Folsomia candida]